MLTDSKIYAEHDYEDCRNTYHIPDSIYRKLMRVTVKF